jgi:hypothetical protein
MTKTSRDQFETLLIEDLDLIGPWCLVLGHYSSDA